MFRLIVFDIDGVLTDGAIIIDAAGNEQKRISLRVLDALASIKEKGFLLAAITGENKAICRFFEKRIDWDAFLSGRKDKDKALEEVVNLLGILLAQAVYVGDGKYDVPAIRKAGLGMCPVDACMDARLNADIILRNGGGNCAEEVLEIVSIKNHHPTSLGFTAAYNLKRLKASRFYAFCRLFFKKNG